MENIQIALIAPCSDFQLNLISNQSRLKFEQSKITSNLTFLENGLKPALGGMNCSKHIDWF